MYSHILSYIVLYFIIYAFVFISVKIGIGGLYSLFSILVPLIFSKFHYGEWFNIIPIIYSMCLYILFIPGSYLFIVKEIIGESGSVFRKTSWYCFLLSFFELLIVYYFKL